jgi:hypothetical protein
MTDVTPDRLGQINGAGDAKALFIKYAMAEIIAAYDENNVTAGRHYERSIPHGKSAAFPATWKVNAGYHVPGGQILGSQKMNKSEIIIAVDDLLISDVVVSNIDELMANVDYRTIYTKEMGAALARAKDKRVLQTGILTARSSGLITGAPGGAAITGATIPTSGDALAAALASAGIAMDQKDVPETGRNAFLRPAQTHLLATTPNVIHKDLGGDGNISTGYIGSYDNIKVVKTNNVPSTVISAVSGENNVYNGDFTKSVGLVMHESAVGTVKLLDLVFEMTGADFGVMYQGTLMVAKYLQGHGKLRPAAAVELALP